mgnify:CR=1 FL=1
MKKLVFIVMMMLASVGCSYSDDTIMTANHLGYRNCSEPDRMFFHSPFVCHNKQVVYYFSCINSGGQRQELVACCQAIFGCQIAPR